MSSTRAFADVVAGIDFAELDRSVRTRAAEVFVDTCAVITRGAGYHTMAALRESVLSTGAETTAGASVLGTSAIAAPALACLLNATAATVDQLDEGHRRARGHAAIHVVPAALATAEQIGANGPDLLAAIIVGYQAAIGVARSLGGMAAGLHPHGNWATIGAAAATAYLIAGPDPAVLAAAMDAAAAVAVYGPYRTASYGADIHHLLAGAGAQLGYLCGVATARGWSSVPDTIGDSFGPRAGAAFELASLERPVPARRDGLDLEIMANYFKRFPTCAHTHPALEAVSQITAAGPIDWRAIRTVRVETYAAAAKLDAPAARSPLAARFSIPVSVAIALRFGGLDATGLTQQRIDDPDVARLAELVQVCVGADLERSYPRLRPARVSVVLADEVLVGHTDLPAGDAENPFARAELRRKWQQLVAHGSDPAAAREICSRLERIETVESVRDRMTEVRSLWAESRAAH